MNLKHFTQEFQNLGELILKVLIKGRKKIFVIDIN